MDENEILHALESLNLQIGEAVSSSDSIIGRRVRSVLDAFKHFDLFNLARSIRLMMPSNRPTQNPNAVNLDYAQWLSSLVHGDKSKKTVVYTCITGGYDNPQAPLYCPENVEYILFVPEDSSVCVSGWSIRKIPDSIIEKYDNTMVNRYIKLHPFDLFKDEFDVSVYVDGNLQPVSDLSYYASCIKDRVGFSAHRHSRRSCVYDEIKACRLMQKGSANNLRSYKKRLEDLGFPHGYGLIECNVLATDLSSNLAKKIYDEWWNELFDSGCMRDQVILPYVLWKNDISIDDVETMGNNVWRDTKLRGFKHN